MFTVHTNSPLILHQHLGSGKTPDGRKFEITTNISDGSPIVKIGEKTVTCDIRKLVTKMIEEADK